MEIKMNIFNALPGPRAYTVYLTNNGELIDEIFLTNRPGVTSITVPNLKPCAKYAVTVYDDDISDTLEAITGNHLK